MAVRVQTITSTFQETRLKKEEKGELSPLPNRETFQKYHMTPHHWPELNRMAPSTAREAEKCDLMAAVLLQLRAC